MLKRVTVYPFLFILYVVLTPLLYNLDQTDPWQAARPLAGLLLVSAVVMIIVWIFLRDWAYSGYLVFLGLAFIFLSAHLVRVLLPWLPGDPDRARQAVLLILGVILVILSSRPVWRRLGGPRAVNPALNVILVLALLSQVLVSLPQLSRAGLARSAADPGTLLPLTGNSASLDCTNRPDIYYLILDAYGRADVLEQVYALDNEPFIEFLESRGFNVIDEAHSNYIQTIFSISSALNFQFIEPEPAGVSGRTYFTQKIANNELMALLKKCGYETVAFETGFNFTNHLNVDTILSSEPGLNEFEDLVLAETPLWGAVKALGWAPPENRYEAHRKRVLETFEQLSQLPGRPGPKFVFAHIITPHPPFVFDETGADIQPRRGYSIGDGNDFRGTPQEYREGYAEQVQFANRMLEETIASILANSASPPIIILQGDHGPGSQLDWDSADRSCLWERTGILNAYYLPGGGADRLYPSITPVNTFRVILNAYFGTDLEMLPDNTYFSSHRLPRQVTDITARRNSKANCNAP
jgi:hypothetical protein